MDRDREPISSGRSTGKDETDDSYILRTRLHELVPTLNAEAPPTSSEAITPFAEHRHSRNYRTAILVAAIGLLLAAALLFAWRERHRAPALLAKGKQLLDQVIQPSQPSRQETAAPTAIKQVSTGRHHERRTAHDSMIVSLPSTDQGETAPATESANAAGFFASVGLWDTEHPALVMAPVSPMRMRIAPHESPAYLLRRVSPAYPEAARNARIQGTVVLRAAISRAGTVENVQPVSGPEPLVGAAMEAVRKWQYRPYYVEGLPQPFETLIVVDFSVAEISPQVPGSTNQSSGVRTQ